jgi:glycosyltransferase involved in cell wall biosynthesis
MIEGQTIIYFGPEPWDGLWRNRHQLMSRLAARNDVWYVEPPTLLRDLLGLTRGNAGTTIRPRSRLFTRDKSGVRVFHSPWWLPHIGREPLKKMSIRLLLTVLSLVTRTGSSRRPIVWYSRPAMIDYLDLLKAKLTVYHVVDEYGGYGHPSKTAETEPSAQETEMLRKVDHVIVVTPTLHERKSPYNPNTHIVPNAVDFSAYSDERVQCPEDMADVRHPFIGYSGLVAARLDLDMLGEAAAARPGWSFVFVGSVNEEYCSEAMQKLREMPNVHFLGQKNVHDVPRYVRQFDVSIIPYVVNLRAQHASPLKLYEYAAAAKPIVSSDFPAARAFPGHVRIATSTDEFIVACEASLDAESVAAELEDNFRIAEQNTWEHRVRQISAILKGRPAN